MIHEFGAKIQKLFKNSNSASLKQFQISIYTLIPCMNISESNEAILMQKKLSKQAKDTEKGEKPLIQEEKSFNSIRNETKILYKIPSRMLNKGMTVSQQFLCSIVSHK